jgi:tRNA 5-methylaminomethyl-2-thiouridine biosynthesis bifunctional protein
MRRALGRRVERLEREGAEWRALDREGRVIAEAPLVIVANAADAARLVPEARLRLSAVRGQVTYLPPSAARRLDVVVSGNGYVAPIPDAGHAVGATYQHDDFDPAVRVADQGDNLARAESLLPGFAAGLDPAALAGWTGFRSTVPDRLPIYGETATDGIFMATGLGSRGLLWAPLGAELLASILCAEPLPLPRDLRGAISPRRFLS